MKDEVLIGYHPNEIIAANWNPATHRLWGFGMAQSVEFHTAAELEGPGSFGIQRFWMYRIGGGQIPYDLEHKIARGGNDMVVTLLLSFEIMLTDGNVSRLMQYQAQEGPRWRWQEREMWASRLRPLVEGYFNHLREHGRDPFEEILELLPTLPAALETESSTLLDMTVKVRAQIAQAATLDSIFVRGERLAIGEGATTHELTVSMELTVLESKRVRAISMAAQSGFVRTQTIHKVRGILEAEMRSGGYLLHDEVMLKQRVSTLLNTYLETYGREVRNLELKSSTGQANARTILSLQETVPFTFLNAQKPQQIGVVVHAELMDAEKFRSSGIGKLETEALDMVKKELDGTLSGLSLQDAIVSKLELKTKIQDGLGKWLAAIGYNLQLFEYSIGTDVPEYGDLIHIQWKEMFPLQGGHVRLSVDGHCMARVRDLKIWKPKLQEGIDIKEAMRTEFKSVVERRIRRLSPSYGVDDDKARWEEEELIQDLKHSLQSAGLEMGLMQPNVVIHLGSNPLATKLALLRATILEMDFVVLQPEREHSYRLHYQVTGVTPEGWQSASQVLANEVGELSKRMDGKLQRKLQYLLSKAHEEIVTEMDAPACKGFMVEVIKPNLISLAQVIGFEVTVLDFFPKENEMQEVARQNRNTIIKERLSLQRQQAARYHELLIHEFAHWNGVLTRSIQDPSDDKQEIATLANEKLKFLLGLNPGLDEKKQDKISSI